MSRLLLVCVLLSLTCLSMRVHGQADIKAILTRAANDLASSVGTTITTGALASGLCFARSDATNNKDTCMNQPSGFTFLAYGDSKVSDGVSVSPPKPGTQITSKVNCPTPSGGTPTTCSVGTSDAKGTTVSVANTQSFTFTQSITVGVSFGEAPLEGKFDSTTSFSVETSTTQTKSDSTTDTATATTSITVPPGSCKVLNIVSTPTITTANAQYTVPLTGGISVWFADAKQIPGGSGNHFNWNPSVGQLVALAVKGGYANGLTSQGDNAVYTGTIMINQQKFASSVTQANCDGSAPTPVTTGSTNNPSSPNTPSTPSTPSTPTGPSGGTYTVKAGDTLSAIAQAKGTTVAAIQKANPSITNPNAISVGQVITIPASSTTGRRMLSSSS